MSDYALAKAIEAIESMTPQKTEPPQKDPRWVAINELYRATTEAYDLAVSAEYQAILARLAAQKARTLAKVRLELLEVDLGLGDDEGGLE